MSLPQWFLSRYALLCPSLRVRVCVRVCCRRKAILACSSLGLCRYEHGRLVFLLLHTCLPLCPCCCNFIGTPGTFHTCRIFPMGCTSHTNTISRCASGRLKLAGYCVCYCIVCTLAGYCVCYCIVCTPADFFWVLDDLVHGHLCIPQNFSCWQIASNLFFLFRGRDCHACAASGCGAGAAGCRQCIHYSLGVVLALQVVDNVYTLLSHWRRCTWCCVSAVRVLRRVLRRVQLS